MVVCPGSILQIGTLAERRFTDEITIPVKTAVLKVAREEM